MEPFTDSNTPPLSIAQVDWTLSGEHELATARRPKGRPLISLDLQESLLAAVITRVGEVEAAESALDQAKSACNVQIAAALAAGVPAEKVREAAASEQWALTPAEFVEDREPAPAEG